MSKLHRRTSRTYTLLQSMPHISLSSLIPHRHNKHTVRDPAHNSSKIPVDNSEALGALLKSEEVFTAHQVSFPGDIQDYEAPPEVDLDIHNKLEGSRLSRSTTEIKLLKPFQSSKEFESTNSYQYADEMAAKVIEQREKEDHALVRDPQENCSEWIEQDNLNGNQLETGRDTELDTEQDQKRRRRNAIAIIEPDQQIFFDGEQTNRLSEDQNSMNHYSEPKYTPFVGIAHQIAAEAEDQISQKQINNAKALDKGHEMTCSGIQDSSSEHDRTLEEYQKAYLLINDSEATINTNSPLKEERIFDVSPESSVQVHYTPSKEDDITLGSSDEVITIKNRQNYASSFIPCDKPLGNRVPKLQKAPYKLGIIGPIMFHVDGLQLWNHTNVTACISNSQYDKAILLVDDTELKKLDVNCPNASVLGCQLVHYPLLSSSHDSRIIPSLVNQVQHDSKMGTRILLIGDIPRLELIMEALAYWSYYGEQVKVTHL